MLTARELLKLANGEEEEEEAPERALTPEEKATVKSFFKSHPSPSDDQVHELAESMKVSPHSLEEEIYKMVGKTAQKHEHVPDSKYNQEQLRMGIKVEKEHTDDPEKAKEISKDHLSELPDYYTRLHKMETEGEKAKEAFYQGFQEELDKIAKQSWKDWAQVNLNPFAQGGRAKLPAGRTFGGGTNQELLAKYMK